MAAGRSPFSSRPTPPRCPRSWPVLALLLLVAGLPRAAVAADAALADPLELATRACDRALAAGDAVALRQVQQQLLQQPQAPERLGPLLARAEALLACRAPASALQVLDRTSPAPGTDRQLWLLMRWQAAQAGLDHRLAADSLWRLAAGELASLEALPLPVSASAQRPALDLLADHLLALGWPERAAAVLLSGRNRDAAGAARLGRAVELAGDWPLEQRLALLERALGQAADAGFWGLAAQLLDQQLALAGEAGDGERALQRRLRLSGRIDDAYGAWQWRPQPQLEQRLRSPREPGGHATSTPLPALP